MSNDIQNSVLLSTFYSGSKKIRVIFHKETIVWDNEKPPSEQHTLPLENVISVQHNYLKNTHPSEDRVIDPNRFTIHYAKQDQNIWKYAYLILKHSDHLQVSSWVKTLQNHLQYFTDRPKKILLFVNPFGGKKNALQIYEKFGQPLFKLAGVEVTVNISQRKDQIRDYVLNHSLDMFDSIGCVGGDGTVSELFNGLVLRECKNHGIDADDMKQDLPKPKIPIGIIPGGSTDTIVYCLHGTIDPTTAVINIIFGQRLGLDLVSVYDEHSLLKLYASVLSYGYLGDLVYHSDKYRWMGPNRYNYSGYFYCPLCKYSSNNEFQLNTHVSLKHPISNKNPKWYSCNMCDFKTVHKSYLKIHKSKRHNVIEMKEEYACEYCEYKAVGKGYLKLHNLSKHFNLRKNFQCDQCNYMTVYKCYLERHKYRIHFETEFKPNVYCDLCEFATKRNEDLKKHLNDKHILTSLAQRFECEICEFITVDEGALQKHKTIHFSRDLQGFKCHQCHFKTMDETILNEHIFGVHRPNELKPIFTCDQCQYTTHNGNFLKYHKYRNHLLRETEQVFPCDQCVYISTDKRNLKRHIYRKHVSRGLQQTIKCKHCNFISFNNIGLEDHKNKKHSKKITSLKSASANN